VELVTVQAVEAALMVNYSRVMLVTNGIAKTRYLNKKLKKKL
jgi:hypothetical protein